MNEPLARIYVSPTRQRAAELFALIADAIQFLGRTAWPVVDLIVRFWIAMPAIVSGLLLANDRNTALMLAISEYPIPWLDPRTEALLGIVLQLAGGFSLLLGLGTRLGALAIVVLNIATQVYYVSLDLDLFRIALAMGYVLRGAGPLSFDSLLIKGLSRSPIPVAAPLAGFLNETRAPLSAAYRFGLRVWLALALLLASSVVSSALGHVAALLSLWLPSASAAALFAGAGPLLAFPLGLGLATRLIAILALCAIGYSEMMAADDFSMFWTLGMALLLVSGPGPLSLDGMILSVLRRRFPQLDGKPAFSLEGLPRVVIIGAGFGGIACARALRHTPVQVTLIDRHNYHLFQPLLYQVATAALSPGDIAVPIRSMFRGQFNTRVLLGNVTDIDARRQQVILQDLTVPFDYLVVATGATHSYFGKDAWARYAPGLKGVDDATAIRRRVLEAFERAEIATSEAERQRLLNFVIVGASPRGLSWQGPLLSSRGLAWERISATLIRPPPTFFWCRPRHAFCRRFPRSSQGARSNRSNGSVSKSSWIAWSRTLTQTELLSRTNALTRSRCFGLPASWPRRLQSGSRPNSTAPGASRSRATFRFPTFETSSSSAMQLRRTPGMADQCPAWRRQPSKAASI